MKILITYAGRNGVAASVAERIARVMTGLGVEITLLSMNAVTTVKGFSAVIAGSLEQSGGWLPEAMEFVRWNQAALNKKPFALFTVITSLATEKGAESHMVIMQYTAHVRGMVHPVSEGFFSGENPKRERVKPGERSKFKLRILLGLLKEGEYRSHEVETWAAKLHDKLLFLSDPGARGMRGAE
jgi:menaquinone-dependent protoporphyrinogen IX oxidase